MCGRAVVTVGDTGGVIVRSSYPAFKRVAADPIGIELFTRRITTPTTMG